MTQRFQFTSTNLKGLIICERKPIIHDLGFFVRFFCEEEFKEIGLNSPILQMNQTLTKMQGSVRGMHFQNPPFSENKIVSCTKGEIFDVAIDIRKNSPTFLQWHGQVLSEDNNKSMYIPEGFAHGFQALRDHCEMLYFHTAVYSPESEGALHWNDQLLAIKWPLSVSSVSARDDSHPFINSDFNGLEL